VRSPRDLPQRRRQKQSLGLDEEAVLDVLAESTIAPAVSAKRTNVEANSYPPRFKLRHAAKDLRLVTEAAEAAGLDLKEANG
jgi:3-hydroxyisobutyrate dehydrogenase-like beta-hydroxyacid dehydrogenase